MLYQFTEMTAITRYAKESSNNWPLLCWYSTEKNAHVRQSFTEDEIAVCAYFIWEQEDKPVGRALDHWLQAELHLAASLWHESLWYQEGRRSVAPR
jgi:hypothetical protein